MYHDYLTGNMKTHMKRAHPDQTIVHMTHDEEDEELMYYEPTAANTLDDDDEQSAVSGHDNPLTGAAEEGMDEPVTDDNQYLLYNIRDHI